VGDLHGRYDITPSAIPLLQNDRPHARRHPQRLRTSAIVGRGDAEQPLEGRAERPEALKADVKADVGHGPVGFAQEEGRALDPLAEQVLVRRRSVGLPERAGEVRRGDVRPGRQRRDIEGFGVARARQIAGAQQMAGKLTVQSKLCITASRIGNVAPTWTTGCSG
jgi:hypothetical protein